MSLTNPNKVITEERLSEFYGQILPYMGGMPDVLANKFSRSDIISTNETLVGTASNGKPLYQIYIEGPAVTNWNTFYTVPNGEDIYILWAQYYKNDSTNDWLLLTGYNSNSEQAGRCQLGIKGNAIKMMSATAGASHPARMLIQYTKFTDSAISIGVDTDYSTDEKIVGTWIDGKPIWQNTVSTGGNVPSGATLILRTAMASTGYDTILYTK